MKIRFLLDICKYTGLYGMKDKRLIANKCYQFDPNEAVEVKGSNLIKAGVIGVTHPDNDYLMRNHPDIGYVEFEVLNDADIQ